MKHISRILSALTALALLAPCAQAESLSFSGTVTAARTVEIYAPIGGTVESIDAEVGQTVHAGDAVATLSTQKVYASEAGTITGIFGQPGDNAETVSERYGAVMYIEGESVYTIAASTENAYNATANKFVHVGEAVFLSCYSDSSHTGTGVITSIEGTDYSVDVTSGAFLVGETVSVYRGDSAVAANRIGRGTLTRKNPTAVTAQGSIVSLAVSNGDVVRRGDLLFETLTGGFDGLYMSGTQITAPEDGVIAQINAQQGSPIEKNSVAAVLYPSDAMRIEAQVNESDLGLITVGDPVSIELLWNQDEEVRYDGTISMISALADESGSGGASSEMEAESEATTYTVYIDFTPDANTRYGMSAVITTFDRQDGSEESDPIEVPSEGEEGANPEAEAFGEQRRERPENMDKGGNFPGGALENLPDEMNGAPEETDDE